jgi:hypothetical protein
MAKLSVNDKTIEKPDGSVADLVTAVDAKRQINKACDRGKSFRDREHRF